ncbi:MAG: hypothetical protein KAT79_00510 [candidate division Zixibacteria bacterium]|nr:hypothetical protein [candidate division Zixibacteria bacterium]
MKLLVFAAISFMFAMASSGKTSENRLLLYAKDTRFLPQIVEILQDLGDHRTGEVLFTSVQSVNKWKINRLDEEQVDALMRYYEDSLTLRGRVREAPERDETVLRMMRNADCYMRIEVLPEPPLIEFQLLITDSLPRTSASQLPLLITGYTRLTGFIVDISDSMWERQLSDGIKAAFPISNSPPVVVLRVDGVKYDGGICYAAVGRQVHIDAMGSFDADHDRGALRFKWWQLNPQADSLPVAAANLLPLDPSGSHQVIDIQKTGLSIISLIVEDGVSESQEVRLTLKAVVPPQLSSSHGGRVVTYTPAWRNNKFTLPLTVTSTRKGTHDIDLLSARQRPKPSIFQRLFGISNGPFKPFEPMKHEAAEVAADSSEIAITTEHEFNMWFGPLKSDMEYEFCFVAVDSFVTSDTICMNVNHSDHNIETTLGLRSVRYHSRNDEEGEPILRGVAASIPARSELQRIVSLSLGLRLNFSKNFLIECGSFYKLYEREKNLALDYISAADGYLGVRVSIWSLGVQNAGRHTGVYWGTDFGVLIGLRGLYFESTYYPRGWSTYSLRIERSVPIHTHSVLALLQMVKGFVLDWD